MKKIILLVVLFSFFVVGANSQLNLGLGSNLVAFRNFNSQSVNFELTGALYADVSYLFNNKKGIKTGFSYQRRNIEFNNENYNSDFYQVPVLFTFQKKLKDLPFGLDFSLGYLLTMLNNTKNSGTQIKLSPIHGVMADISFFTMINEKSKMFLRFNISDDLYSKDDLLFGQYCFGFGMNVNLFSK
ncbi:MAG: hypothetical protein U9Q83_02305 [Bacteroidota bacterium]|nr:hypothetical protein [Bacteroidota bacterium]